MLLSSVIIILREVLEAALIISIFLAFNKLLHFSRRWLLSALVLGALGAIAYASSIDRISDSLGGLGQEITNGILHFVLYGLLLVFNVTLLASRRVNKLRNYILYTCIVASVALAVTREGSEIFIYLYGFVHMPNQLTPMLIGGTIGAGIGFSVGIIFYYLLVALPDAKLLPVGIIIIMLVGASMILQATQQFIQADILPSQSPLWDSGSWLAEQSITGQLLYALLGYEATPTPLQMLFYFASIAIMLLSVGFMIWRNKIIIRQ